MGVGDHVPEAIESLGVSVELLDDATLASGDLSRFDTIVTGIRAYKERRGLIDHPRRLARWVERGGRLVVQYNKYEYLRGPTRRIP